MQGLILIPDITGFTKFVKNIDIDIGVRITRELLLDIIENNPLNLDISEIEGDAILFYKTGHPISLVNVLPAVKEMYDSFHAKLRSISEEYAIPLDISLKFILHYGKLAIYDVKGFRKLYGQAVIESHRLLKTGIKSSDYILVSEDYINALNGSGSFPLLYNWSSGSFLSEIFTDLREIKYNFFNLVNPETTLLPAVWDTFRA